MHNIKFSINPTNNELNYIKEVSPKGDPEAQRDALEISPFKLEISTRMFLKDVEYYSFLINKNKEKKATIIINFEE